MRKRHNEYPNEWDDPEPDELDFDDESFFDVDDCDVDDQDYIPEIEPIPGYLNPNY